MTTEGHLERPRLGRDCSWSARCSSAKTPPLFPGTKIRVNGTRARKLAGQEAPRAPGAKQVKNRVEDRAQVGGARSPARARRRQVRGDPGPSGVVEVGVVDSGVHGSRHGADAPCFARRGNFSNTL